jgi:hypothetical protein
LLAIDDVEKAAASVPRSNDHEWFVRPVVPDRLFVARDSRGTVVLFLIGPRESFGNYLSRQSLEYSESIQVVSASSKVQGARLSFLGSEHASRAACHVAVEIADSLATNPAATNEAILTRIAWLIDLMESRWSILSDERARGLAGECIFLRRLLGYATRSGLSLVRVLDVWHGSKPARRDAAGPGVAIEVKCTSLPERCHRIGSIEQLLPHGSEEVYLFSVGLRLDPSGPRPLSAYIADVRNQLVQADGKPDYELQELFAKKLKEYGYDQSLAPSYDRAYRFLAPHLTPQFFRAAALQPLAPSHFVHGGPPSHVTSISYDLTINSSPLTAAEEDIVFAALLRAA